MELFDEILQSYGGIQQMQDRFGLKSPQAVYNWRYRGIPKGKLIDIHLDTSIPLSRLNSGQKKSQIL